MEENKLAKILKGNKTYIIIAVMLLLGILEGFDICQVPERVWFVLGLAGFGFAKKGVNRIETIVEELRKDIDKKK